MLERLEVLRGPASVLYGKSSPGGIVEMISKRPTIETLREVQFKMGSDNLFQTGFDFGGAIDDNGVYSYRLTGLASSTEAQQDMAKEKRYAIAPSFTWQPDSATLLTLLTNIQNEPDLGYYGWLPKEGTVTSFRDANDYEHKLSTQFNEGEASNKFSRNQKMVGYNFEHAFNDTWTIRQNLRYSTVKSDFRFIYGSGISSPGILSRGYVQSQEALSSFDVDTQTQATFLTADIAHTLLMGVDYLQMRNDVNSWYGTASDLSMSNPVYGNDTITDLSPYSVLNRQKQTGIYMQDQAEWNHWVLTLVSRYDWAETSADDRNSSINSETNDKQLTWRGGINYLFNNGVSPYISYSESFEPTSGTSASGNVFKPSHGKQYETGIKYVSNDRPLVLTAAIYQLTKDNNLTTDPVHSTFSIQTGEIRSRGIELEAKAALTQDINIIASWAMTDAKYTKDTTLQGKHPYQIPKYQAALWADYTFNEMPLSGLTLGGGVRYVGQTYGDDTNSFTVAPYALVDSVVKYDLAHFGLAGTSVAINVNNLLNRHYVASCYADYACYWGTDRRIIATATFSF